MPRRGRADSGHAVAVAGDGCSPALIDGTAALRSGATRKPGVAGWNLAIRCCWPGSSYAAAETLPMLAQVLLARWRWWCRWGRWMYRLAFQPVAEGAGAILLIVSVAGMWRWWA